MTWSAAGQRPLIVDAGANIWASAIFFLREFPNARIVAIEPDEANFEILSRNAADLPISCIDAAVTSRPMPVRLVNPGEGYWGFRTEPLGQAEAATAAVESVQIAQIFDAQPPDTYPYIVKLDIEGAEAEVFSQNTEWLRRTPLVIIELHDWLLPK
jgi:FkbM family methyltransferase